MTLRLSVEETYAKGLKSLPPDRRKAANAALMKFVADPSLPSLRFRPLRGRPNHFIINPTRGDRVILRKDADDLYAAVDVGPHDNVYRRWDR
jgi:mRNA-degrading endonuclease RelE of RelBE toxin-antitoxin system